MLRRTPLKPKAKRKSAAMKRYHDWVARRGCVVCSGEATIHHVTGYADRMGRLPRSDERVVPLCPMHHQKIHDPFQCAPVSVEALGHRGFYALFGVDLLELANDLWAEWGAA